MLYRDIKKALMELRDFADSGSIVRGDDENELFMGEVVDAGEHPFPDGAEWRDPDSRLDFLVRRVISEGVSQVELDADQHDIGVLAAVMVERFPQIKSLGRPENILKLCNLGDFLKLKTAVSCYTIARIADSGEVGRQECEDIFKMLKATLLENAEIQVAQASLFNKKPFLYLGGVPMLVTLDEKFPDVEGFVMTGALPLLLALWREGACLRHCSSNEAIFREATHQFQTNYCRRTFLGKKQLFQQVTNKVLLNIGTAIVSNDKISSLEIEKFTHRALALSRNLCRFDNFSKIENAVFLNSIPSGGEELLQEILREYPGTTREKVIWSARATQAYMVLFLALNDMLGDRHKGDYDEQELIAVMNDLNRLT